MPEPGVSGVRARRALRRRGGALGAAARRARLPARPRRGRRRDVGARVAALALLPEQPDGRGGAALVLRAGSWSARSSTTCSSARTRRTPSSGSTSRPRRPSRSRDRRNVVVFNTLSKRSSMTGYRCGFVAADEGVIESLRKFRPNVGTAPQEFVQRAAVAAWNDEEHVERNRALYGRKRRLLRRRSSSARACALVRERARRCTCGSRSRTARRPSSSPRACSSTGSSSRRAAYFGDAGEGYVRFALVPTEEECAEAVAAPRRGPVSLEREIDALWEQPDPAGVERRRGGRRPRSTAASCASPRSAATSGSSTSG